jgi:hypothetical protein
MLRPVWRPWNDRLVTFSDAYPHECWLSTRSIICWRAAIAGQGKLLSGLAYPD